jgi:hypothetical protein
MATGNTENQVTSWWDEVESAIQARRIPRARRFLRWILAVHPEDEEAWLRSIQLAPTLTEQLAFLQQAYSFHPHSQRVLAALREVRIRQLESAVHDLVPWPAVLHCLPDQRRSIHGSVGPQNGKGQPSRPGIQALSATSSP